MNGLTANELKAAIVREPLTVAMDTTVETAIGWMNHLQSNPSRFWPDDQPMSLHRSIRSSCILVMDDDRVVGLLTESDVVRLCAQQQPFHQLRVQQVMTPVALTLQASKLTDPTAIRSLLQQQQIRYLPIVDDENHLLGLITHESLCQALIPLELTSPGDVHQPLQTQLNVCQQTASQFQKLAATLPGSLYTLLKRQDGSTTFTYMSPQTPEIYELELGDILEDADRLFEQIHPDDRAAYTAAVDQSAATLQPFCHEWRMIMPSGKMKWLRAHSRPEQLPNQDILWHGVALDITELKQAGLDLERLNAELEQRVAQRTTELQDLFDNANDLIQSVLLESGRFEYVNRSWREALGYSILELNELTVFDVLHPDCWDHCRKFLAQMLNGKLSVIERLELVFITKSKAELVVEGSINCRYQDGRPVATRAIFRNITERKLAEKLLHDREARYRALMDGASDAILLTDLQGNLLEVNDKAEKLLGYTRHELTSMHFTQLHSPEDLPDTIRAFQRLVKQEISQVLDINLRCKNGDIIPVDITASVLEINGQTLVQGIFRDIRDRKRAELALQESEATMRALIASVPDLLVRMRQDGLQLKVMNQGAVHCITLNGQMENHFVYEIMPAKIAEERIALAQKAISTQEIQYQEFEFIFEGRQCYEEARIVPLWRDEVLVVVRDMTERQAALREREQAEQKLRDRNLLLSTISQAQTQFITATNRFVIFEQLLEGLLELTQSEYGFIGEVLFQEDGSVVMEESFLKVKGIPELKSTNIANITWDQATRRSCEDQEGADIELDSLNALLGAVIMTGKTVIENHLTTDFMRDDFLSDQISLHTFLGLPLFQGAKLVGMIGLANRSGGYDGECMVDLAPFLGTCSNLIEGYRIDRKRRNAEEKLYLTNEELARATRLKDEFMANMSHELRTPLNAILGMTEGLQEAVFGPISKEQTKSLHIIETSATHLLSLINDILDVAKIESGQIELEFTSVPVTVLCSSSLAFIKQQALRKRIQIDVQMATNLPQLWVDERRIRQVLINLLTNAVKFTPDGGNITLAVAYLESETTAQQQFLRVSVTDTGIGIAPENLDKLFQPFVQIDSALNRQYNGTGLGLTLVKQIVELHGGQVGLTSTLGVGSCFTIDLPCAPTPILLPVSDLHQPHEQGMPINDSLDHPPLTRSPLILLAEDNEANISTLSSYLQAKGYQLRFAKNGQEAIEVANAEHPDLILMDIQMPGMDGLEAIQHIRQDATLASIPIIAVTALAMMGDRERCLAAGANDYLTKPLKLKQLVTVMHNLLTAPFNS